MGDDDLMIRRGDLVKYLRELRSEQTDPGIYAGLSLAIVAVGHWETVDKSTDAKGGA